MAAGLPPAAFLYMPYGELIDLLDARDILMGVAEEGPELNKYGGEYF
ncbi:hypothetical protein AAK706_07455 [Erysipelotrichaceae bacterium 66-17]